LQAEWRAEFLPMKNSALRKEKESLNENKKQKRRHPSMRKMFAGVLLQLLRFWIGRAGRPQGL
jgi:hypothetical protein